jgi:hypothetical protein
MFKLPKNSVKIETSDPWLESYQCGSVRVNVWRNSKNTFYTVGTCLVHPKKGKTQLFRKFCTKEEVEMILQNPRIHTGKGYRTNAAR